MSKLLIVLVLLLSVSVVFGQSSITEQDKQQQWYKDAVKRQQQIDKEAKDLINKFKQRDKEDKEKRDRFILQLQSTVNGWDGAKWTCGKVEEMNIPYTKDSYGRYHYRLSCDGYKNLYRITISGNGEVLEVWKNW